MRRVILVPRTIGGVARSGEPHAWPLASPATTHGGILIWLPRFFRYRSTLLGQAFEIPLHLVGSKEEGREGYREGSESALKRCGKRPSRPSPLRNGPRRRSSQRIHSASRASLSLTCVTRRSGTRLTPTYGRGGATQTTGRLRDGCGERMVTVMVSSALRNSAKSEGQREAHKDGSAASTAAVEHGGRGDRWVRSARTRLAHGRLMDRTAAACGGDQRHPSARPPPFGAPRSSALRATMKTVEWRLVEHLI